MLHLIGLLALALPAADKAPDAVRTKDGKELKGRVVYEGPESLRIRRGASELEIAKSNTSEVRTLERSLKEAVKRWDSIRKDDTGALAELANFCDERGLSNEARNFRLRILLAGGADPETVRGADGRLVAGKVQIENDDRWLPVDDWRAGKAKWQDAVELHTTHFDVRSDLPMDRVLDAAIQLERLYLRFYEFLAPELVLYVFDETPEVRFYAREKDAPPSWTRGQDTWFGPGENKLHVLVTDDIDLKVVLREATDLLLFNAFRRSSGKTGQIPAWSVAGFAEYFGGTAGSKPGDAWAPLGTPYRALFATYAVDEKPLEMKQLMRSSLGEINRGSDAPRRSAQAYALVHYLMHADGGAHREVFFRQLRQAWKGKSIEEDLLRALNTTQEKLQASVQAHAKANSQ